MQNAVRDVFGPVNPREDITLERLSSLILEVRKKVEGATEEERREHKWLSYLLPPREEEDFVLRESGMDTAASPLAEANNPLAPSSADTSPSASPSANPSLRRLLDETSDLIDSPTFTHVLTLLLNTTFSHLIDQRIALEAFKITPTASNQVQELDAKCKVAQTLAVFCRQAHVIAAGGGETDELATDVGVGANEYLALIDQVGDLEGFAAVIYSSNFEFEGIDEDGLDQPSTIKTQRPVSDVKSVVAGAEEKLENAVAGAEEKLENTVAGAEEKVEDAAENIRDKAELPLPVTESPGFESAWKQALDKEDGKT